MTWSATHHQEASSPRTTQIGFINDLKSVHKWAESSQKGSKMSRKCTGSFSGSVNGRFRGGLRGLEVVSSSLVYSMSYCRRRHSDGCDVTFD